MMQKREVTLRYATPVVLLAACFATAPWLIADEQPQKAAKPPNEAQKSHSNRAVRLARANAVEAAPANNHEAASAREVQLLKQQLAAQQQQIEQLRIALEEQRHMLEQALRSSQPATSSSPNLGEVASIRPVIPAASPKAVAFRAAGGPPTAGPAATVTREQVQQYTTKIDELGKKMDGVLKNVGGFRLGGDFRYRFDGIWRSANSAGAAQQNFRERYRLRFNVDRAISDQFDAHFTVGSGVFNNPLTFDTDFTGVNQRGPLFITEWWGAFHPNKYLDLRGGKMPEVFADGSRFFFDDDLRLNGFQETVKVPFATNALGVKSVEFRGGQYILTNPNVQVLPSAAQCAGATPPAACAYLAAGFQPGGKVRDTNLFEQGIAFLGDIKEGWSHQFIVNAQLWRNQNELALASTAAGFPLLVNPYYGVPVTSPLPGTGNATTTKGGAIFTAPHFQVGRVNYRLQHTGWKTSHQNVPVWLDLQASKNFGVSFAQYAWMATLSVGEVKKGGDLRFLYQYGYKDANSMISQLTDDDFGTGSGVNIKTHGIRVDLGLNKFLEWDTKLFVQDPVRGNDPARNLFVPVPAGVNTSYRVQSEFNVKF